MTNEAERAESQEGESTLPKVGRKKLPKDQRRVTLSGRALPDTKRIFVEESARRSVSIGELMDEFAKRILRSR
jgi:hypothetical protein